MRKKGIRIWIAGIASVAAISGCGMRGTSESQEAQASAAMNSDTSAKESAEEEAALNWTEEITELEDGLSVVRCDALIVGSGPDSGYASISTVNVDFIRRGASGLTGLAVSVNMIQEALTRDEVIATGADSYSSFDGVIVFYCYAHCNYPSADTVCQHQRIKKPGKILYLGNPGNAASGSAFCYFLRIAESGNRTCTISFRCNCLFHQ